MARTLSLTVFIAGFMVISFQGAEWLARQEAAGALPQVGAQYMQLLGEAEASQTLLEDQLPGWGQTSPDQAGMALQQLTYQHYQHRAQSGRDQQASPVDTDQQQRLSPWMHQLARSQRMAIQGHWWQNGQDLTSDGHHIRQGTLPLRAFQQHTQVMLERAQNLQKRQQFPKAEAALLHILGASRSLAYSAPSLYASEQALLIHHRALKQLAQLYAQTDRQQALQWAQQAQTARKGGQVLTLVSEAQQSLEGLWRRGSEVIKHPHVPAALKWDLFQAGRITQLCYGGFAQLDVNRPDLRASLFREPGGSWIYRQLEKHPFQGIASSENTRESFQECWTVSGTRS